MPISFLETHLGAVLNAEGSETASELIFCLCSSDVGITANPEHFCRGETKAVSATSVPTFPTNAVTYQLGVLLYMQCMQASSFSVIVARMTHVVTS